MNRRAETYFGAPCRHGHSGERYSSGKECVACVRERSLRPDAVERRKLADVRSPERCVERVRRYQATTRGRAVRLYHSARSRTDDVSITPEWIQKRLDAGVCEISGLPFDFMTTDKQGPFSPSVDRINPSDGYTPQNCRVILWALNAAFSHWGHNTFEVIARAWIGRGVAPPVEGSRGLAA